MKTILNRFFVTLGVIFFMLICSGVYLWYRDVYGVRTIVSFLVSSSHSAVQEVTKQVSTMPGVPLPVTDSSSATTIVTKPSSAQVDAAKAAGVSPSLLPSVFTTAQVECFTTILGTERVTAIKGGSVPSKDEIVRVSPCLKK